MSLLEDIQRKVIESLKAGDRDVPLTTGAGLELQGAAKEARHPRARP